MASRFSDIVDSVEARMAQPDVTFVKGRLSLKENARWPQICWIPVSANHTMLQDMGGKLDTSGAVDERSVGVATRSLQVEAHCWGETLETTEQLIHDVLVAARQESLGAIHMVGEEWDTQTTSADWLVDGQKAIVTFIFDIPVLREERPLTTITSEQQTCYWA